MAGDQLRRMASGRPGDGIHLQTITPDLARGLGLARDWGVVSQRSAGRAAAVAGVKMQTSCLPPTASPSMTFLLALHLITRQVGDVNLACKLRGDQTLAST
jgi:hypothetical protein